MNVAQIPPPVLRNFDIGSRYIEGSHKFPQMVFPFNNQVALKLLFPYFQLSLLIFSDPDENPLIEVVLIELPLEDGIGSDVLLLNNLLIDLPDFLGPLLIFLLLLAFLLGLNFPIIEDLINRKIHLPEYPLDKRGNNICDNDVHDAEVHHNVAEILRVSPTVIEGDQ